MAILKAVIERMEEKDMFTCIKSVWASDNPKLKERFADTSRYNFYDQALFIKATINPICDYALQNLILKSYAKHAVKELVCKMDKHQKNNHNFYSSNNWNTPDHNGLYLDHMIQKIARTRSILVRQV